MNSIVVNTPGLASAWRIARARAPETPRPAPPPARLPSGARPPSSRGSWRRHAAPVARAGGATHDAASFVVETHVTSLCSSAAVAGCIAGDGDVIVQTNAARVGKDD